VSKSLIIEETPGGELRRVKEVVVTGAKKVGKAVKEYVPPVLEYMATEKFPSLVKNVVFMVMVGVMVYNMIRILNIVTPAAEYAAGQFASFMGTIVAIAVPLMMLFLVIAIIKGIISWAMRW